MTEPYRAEHIGSLLRPADLLQARSAHQDGRIDRDELRRVEDRSIADILAMQRAVGLDVVSDGEYRRAGWMGGFWDSVEGFVPHPVTRVTKGHDGPHTVQTSHPVVAAELKRIGRVSQSEASFLAANAGAP